MLLGFRQYLVTACLFSILIGLNFADAPVLMSIGTILLVANAVLNPNVKEIFQRAFTDKVNLAIISFYVLHLLSGLVSENMDHFLWNLRLKLPFLLLPLAFAAIRPLSERYFHQILYGFVATTTLISMGVVTMYLIDFEAINKGYELAKVMPTPTSHPRFSLLVGFAIVAGGYLFTKKFKLRYDWEPKVIAAAIVFLILFIHLLAVRSGLFALYIVMGYIALRNVFQSGRPLRGVIILAAILALPIGAYLTIPTFKNKINYMRYDLSMYQSDRSTSDHSDGGRILSIKAGIHVGNQSPLIGVGIGDLVDEMQATYASDFPMMAADYRFIPHNQFASYYAAFGFVGLAWFLVIFFYPIIRRRGFQNVLLMSLLLFVFTSFLSESTLEGQVGIAFYLVFLLLIHNRMETHEQALSSHHNL
jgi:O-antigen ligase